MRLFLFINFFFLSTLIWSQTNVVNDVHSSWIKPADIPTKSKVSKYDVKSGWHFKLIDYQIDVENSEYYKHFVYNVMTSGGVSSLSQLQITFDSSYQRVVFHEYKIYRKGDTLDRTRDVTFEYVKNETQLQSNIYTGYVTALSVLPDIRRGDWVEISYSVIGSNPVYNGSRYFMVPINDINPVDKSYLRIKIPREDDKYIYRASNPSIKIKKQNIEDYQILLIDESNPKKFEFEETIPTWVIPYQYIEVSNTPSWEMVKEWANQLFVAKDDNKITQVFEEIFYPEDNTEEKIDAIVNFVQDEIRYMGIESGIGSIKPFPPNKVIEQRFGDCKDKSLLMSSMLNKIGIKASPALVNSALLGRISSNLPSGKLFDHVIVYMEYGGDSYWIDPTYSFQGGSFYNTMIFDYEKALIVNDASRGLTELNVIDTTTCTELNEFFNLTNFKKPGELKVKTSLKGSNADQTRNILEYYSLSELADYYKSTYAKAFPTIEESENMLVEDETQTNILKTTETYTIRDIWKDSQQGYENMYVVNYEPISLYSYLYSLSCDKKQYSVQMRYPAKYVQNTTLEFPRLIAVNDYEKTWENKAFKFTKKQKLLSLSTVKLTYEFESFTKEINAEDFEEICLQLDEIIEGIPMVFYFNK